VLAKRIGRRVVIVLAEYINLETTIKDLVNTYFEGVFSYTDAYLIYNA